MVCWGFRCNRSRQAGCQHKQNDEDSLAHACTTDRFHLILHLNWTARNPHKSRPGARQCRDFLYLGSSIPAHLDSSG